jgi:antitoxin (DNA-binding transcriptional repressor) of toxin-antitoxin stability system
LTIYRARRTLGASRAPFNWDVYIRENDGEEDRTPELGISEGIAVRQITVEDAAARLQEIVREAGNGEEIVLLQGTVPMAKLVPISGDKPRARRGSMKGVVLAIADDFDAIPEGFEEYGGVAATAQGPRDATAG